MIYKKGLKWEHQKNDIVRDINNFVNLSVSMLVCVGLRICTFRVCAVKVQTIWGTSVQ